MTFSGEYENFYEEYIDCDFCGQMTRGRVYDDKPNQVYCGSCHGLLRLVNDEVVKSK